MLRDEQLTIKISFLGCTEILYHKRKLKIKSAGHFVVFAFPLIITQQFTQSCFLLVQANLNNQ